MLQASFVICSLLLIICVPQSGSPFTLAASNQQATYDCTTATGLDGSDCEVLVTFYNETGGPTWVDKTDWLQTSTPCSWLGITCTDKRVTQLSLYSNQLGGPIPSVLGQLANLIELDLSFNQLSGVIPPELGELTNLLELSLSGNQLSDTIPPVLGQLSNLTSLSLNSNQLSGTIPPVLGQLSNLSTLRLDDNELSGLIPLGFGQLSNLTDLWLYSNQLSGPIPIELGQLSNLTGLRLGQNQLSGSIPTELGQLTNLTSLSLNSNHLSGTIPAELGQLSSLIGLGLNSNQLSGTIPPELGQLSTLTSLRLDGNELSGLIPAELGQLSNLTELWLYGNQLSGSIPADLGQLSNLTGLWLHNNQLNGSIPPELGQLSNLTGLWLYNNQLNGSIPAELGQLSALTILALDGNQLSGSIPPELGQLFSLTDLTLYSNELSGPIPPTLGQLSNLKLLSLYRNELSGLIPTELGQLIQLTELALYTNELSGPIPPALGQLTNLTELSLYTNELSGPIPPEFGQLTNLTRLVLYGNQLSGPIPAELGQLSTLLQLYLDNNQLSGDIPASLACPPTWQNLTSFDIDFNRFTADSAEAATCLEARNSGWALTQTIPPSNLQASVVSPTAIRLQWSPVALADTAQNGYYEVGLSVDGGETYSVASTTTSKTNINTTLTNLIQGTDYVFAVRTVTLAHSDQQNQLISDWSESARIAMSEATPSAPSETQTPSTSTPVPPTNTPTAPTNTPIAPTPSQGNEFEDNDSCAEANPIQPNGSTQEHTFLDQADTDWITFNATAGTLYRVEVTTEVGSLADVTMEVYRGCSTVPDSPVDPSFNPGVRLDLEVTEDGPIHLKLENFDATLFGDEAKYSLSVRSIIETDDNRALIIVGGRLKGTDRLQTNINDVTERVYRLFQQNGYTDENIFYMATTTDLPGLDGKATKDLLKTVITTWAAEALDENGVLTLYMIDHGSPETFYIDELNGQRVSPTELNDWLDELEAAVPGITMNIIIEACQSGSFIDNDGGSISKAGRVVITSTDAVNDAKASRDGAYFSDHLLTRLQLGETLASSFSQAQRVALSVFALQDAWIDANGNGVANEFEDALLAAERSFEDVGTLSSVKWAPHIFSAGKPEQIVNASAMIQADVRDDIRVSQVWAIVYPPDYVTPRNVQELQAEILPSFILAPTGEDNLFAASYPGFNQPGTYRIVINAVDNGGLVAAPQEIEVVVAESLQSQGKIFLPFAVQ